MLLFPGFQILDAAGPMAAFEIASRFAPDAYRIRTVAAGAGMIASSAGAAMPADKLSAQRGIDTLLIVGGAGTGAAMADAKLINAIKR
jgi:transcriptional regulator GlxA family with amidase domain